jgi:hypothetical protein
MFEYCPIRLAYKCLNIGELGVYTVLGKNGQPRAAAPFLAVDEHAVAVKKNTIHKGLI